MTSAALLAIALAACGGGEAAEPIAAPSSVGASSADGSTIAGAEGTNGGTTSSDADGSLAAGTDSELQLCSDVPLITTDVIGDMSGATNPDDIFMGVIRTYGNEHRDVFGSLLIDRQAGGTVVLAVTDDPEPHRSALALRRPMPTDDVGVQPPPPIEDDRPIGEWGVAFDVVRVEFTEAELLDVQRALTPLLEDPDVPIDGSSGGGLRNVVELSAAREITQDEADALATVVAEMAPLEAVCLEARIVDRAPTSIKPGTPLDVIELPGPDGTFSPETPVECGGVPFTLGAIQPLRPLADFPDLQTAIDEASTSEEMNFVRDGQEWWLLDMSEGHARVISPDGSSFAMVPLELTRAGWAVTGLSGASDCTVRRVLPSGLNRVEWELDPAFAAPTATSTEIHVLVTEVGCASGREMGDQLLGPELVETDDAVRIAFAVIPPPGSAQECPGNPPSAVTVSLDAPLGDRSVRDGLAIGAFAELATFP